MEGMTVIISDTTEYDSQSNGPAELAVREVKVVARSIRVALGELYKTDTSSKHPALPWLVSHTAGQITRGQIEADGKNTTSETERETIPQTAPCFR